MAVLPLDQCRGGVIRRIAPVNPALRRLVEMGATPGAHVQVIRRAPLGDPMQIALRGCAVTLRRRDAAQIDVERDV
ncbi:MAG: FeoA family protein [Christensenellales bacterium]|jgi:ferrous iron transport protein A